MTETKLRFGLSKHRLLSNVIKFDNERKQQDFMDFRKEKKMLSVESIQNKYTAFLYFIHLFQK